MSEERLNDLAMLSIESEQSKKLDTSKLLNVFAQENREGPLQDVALGKTRNIIR